ncbi:MAG: hypothetical protein AVDCRST_MAG89-3923, partial [uncultured Gemmatimonadetes bacterium]
VRAGSPWPLHRDDARRVGGCGGRAGEASGGRVSGRAGAFRFSSRGFTRPWPHAAADALRRPLTRMGSAPLLLLPHSRTPALTHSRTHALTYSRTSL